MIDMLASQRGSLCLGWCSRERAADRSEGDKVQGPAGWVWCKDSDSQSE